MKEKKKIVGNDFDGYNDGYDVLLVSHEENVRIVNDVEPTEIIMLLGSVRIVNTMR